MKKIKMAGSIREISREMSHKIEYAPMRTIRVIIHGKNKYWEIYLKERLIQTQSKNEIISNFIVKFLKKLYWIYNLIRAVC